MKLNIIPTEEEFAAFYILQILNFSESMYNEKVLKLSGLTSIQVSKIIEKYDDCYNVYILQKQILPTIQCWKSKETKLMKFNIILRYINDKLYLKQKL